MSERACPHIESAYDWLAGRLTGADKSAFEEHLAGCDACRAEVAGLEETLGHLAAWTQPSLSPAFRNEVLARLEVPRPGLAARFGGWFRFRPLPLVAGALVAAGLVVAVIGFFPQIMSELAPRRERLMVRTDRAARAPRPAITGQPKRAKPEDIVRPRPQPAVKVAPPSPPPPPPPAPRARPAPSRAPAGTAAKRVAPPARARLKMAARPRSVAPAPGAEGRSRSGVRTAPPAPRAPDRGRVQQYSVQPRKGLFYRQPRKAVPSRGGLGLTRSARRPRRAVRPAPAAKTTTLKSVVTALEKRQRLPQNLAMVLSLVERYGGTVRKPYRKTARGLILEVTVPPANRRVFLTRLRGLKGQGITRLGTDLTPIRVLVSKSPRTGPATNNP